MKMFILSFALLNAVSAFSAVKLVENCTSHPQMPDNTFNVQVLFNTANGGYRAKIMHSTLIGPVRAMERRKVRRSLPNPHIAGAPVTYHGHEFKMSVNSTTTPFPGNGHYGYVQAVLDNGRELELQVVCRRPN